MAFCVFGQQQLPSTVPIFRVNHTKRSDCSSNEAPTYIYSNTTISKYNEVSSCLPPIHSGDGRVLCDRSVEIRVIENDVTNDWQAHCRYDRSGIVSSKSQERIRRGLDAKEQARHLAAHGRRRFIQYHWRSHEYGQRYRLQCSSAIARSEARTGQSAAILRRSMHCHGILRCLWRFVRFLSMLYWLMNFVLVERIISL